MAFTAEQGPSVPRLRYACDIKSQHHLPWLGRGGPGGGRLGGGRLGRGGLGRGGQLAGGGGRLGDGLGGRLDGGAGIPAPSFAKFYSLIHRDLTRKGPSISPHPHVDFEQPAPGPRPPSPWTGASAGNCLE